MLRSYQQLNQDRYAFKVENEVGHCFRLEKPHLPLSTDGRDGYNKREFLTLKEKAICGYVWQ